jgi:hypothetical protein
MKKNGGRRHLITLLMIILTSLSLHSTGKRALAQEAVTAELTAEQTEVTVGDVAPLVLSVTHPAGYRLIPLQPNESLGEFEVRSVSPVAVEDNQDGTETSRQTLNVTLWAPGNFTTPDLPVSVADNGGNLVEVSLAPITFTVNSVLLEGDTELRDIKAQATEPIPPVWPWILGGLALFALALFLLWRLIRRWRANRLGPTEATPDLRPAYQIALDELARIEQLGLPAQQRFKEHFTLVSDALRDYLERAYAVPATDQTTFEIQEALKTMALQPAQKRGLLNILNEADLVKFAKVKPDMSTATEFPSRARSFVIETRPTSIASSANGQTAQSAEVHA